MKRQEFLELIDQYGISLSRLGIRLDEISGWEGDHGIYEEDGKWFYYSSDGRNHIDKTLLENEEIAFDKMFHVVFVDLDIECYLTLSIDEEIVKIKKNMICQFIRETYSMSEQQANDAWEYLKNDMHALFEFKYYVAKGDFVPADDCYKVQGYSAEQLYTTTYLEVLGAFNYLVYLKTKPQEALDKLKKGLPRRKVFSDKDLKAVQKKMDEKTTAPVEKTEPLTEQSAEQSIEQPTTAPDSQGELLAKLDAVQQELADLQKKFDDKIAEDTHKNGLFDNMHRELVRYQNGVLDKIVDTMALDIIQLVDSTKSHARVYSKKEPTEENYKKLLKIVKGIAEDLGDILYRQNIESYRVTGHEVDARRQKIIQTVPTDDKSKNNLVAVRVADGYEKGDKVLRPERIKIFKYEEPSDTAAETSSEN